MIEIAGATQGVGATNGAAKGATNTAAMERARAPADPALAHGAELGPLQRSCLVVLRAQWSSLAVVGMDPGARAQAFADTLAEVSRAYRLAPVRVLAGAAPSASQLAAVQDELSARGGAGRVVVAVDDAARGPGGAPLLVHAEAVVFVVRLGATELRAVEQLAELVGRERVLGCVVTR